MISLILTLAVLFSPSASAQVLSEEAVKNAFRVLKEKDNIVALNKPNLTVGQRILFLRNVPELGEYETIAQGAVTKSNDKISVVMLDTDSLRKIPERGDYAVVLGQPRVFEEAPGIKPTPLLEITQEEAVEPEEGYIEFSPIYFDGKTLTETSNQANSFKNIPTMKMSGYHLEWYLDFLSNYGITLNSTSGAVPVRSYLRRDEDTSLDSQTLRLNFRTRKSDRNIRWTFYIENQTDEFKTTNIDEYLIASRYASTGLGGRLTWEMGHILTQSTPWYGRPTRFYIEGSYAPSLTATDLTVSRGSSSPGSSRMNYAIGYSHLFHWNGIPWVKRWFLDIQYYNSNFDLKFSGPTRSEQQGIYEIPANGAYKEHLSGIQILFGVRFVDMIGRNFKPRN